MARRSQPMIEDFDDDTDLPLPSRPLVHTDPRRAVIQSVDSDSDEDEAIDRGQRSAGPASLPQTPSAAFGAPPSPSGPAVSDLTPYKKCVAREGFRHAHALIFVAWTNRWTCIYPIYIDAKRRYGTGSRRVAREKSVWWPLSKDIADAASRLGLGTLHEVQKCHPADWDNPGRVRVQWRRDGILVNPGIRNSTSPYRSHSVPHQ